MYKCKSHGNVYMEISSKSIHANLKEMYTWKSHRNGYMQISSRSHGNGYIESHEKVYMPIS